MKALLVWSVLLLFLVGGCAGLQPDLPKPAVSISGFKMLPSNGIVPRFEIRMRVVNTGRTPLDIEGVVYTVELDGNRILTGVAKNLPVIAAYSEGNVTVSGTPDLFGSLGFFQKMVQERSDGIAYNIDVAIDVGTFYPTIRTSKHGTFSLSDVVPSTE
ncbi:MAG: hypothetical protein DSZ03_07905 [Sulfurimonas sp.]|nr:MAG: hypothetical protein DSZ03_07905 [Sulfurimonas sp.]